MGTDEKQTKDLLVAKKELVDVSSEYQDEYQKLLRERAVEARIPVIKEDTEMLLSNLVIEKRPKRLLEIGTAVGYSAIALYRVMKLAYKDAEDVQLHIDTIERDELLVKEAKEIINDLGYKDGITVVQGEARDVIPRLSKGYDFIFIDAAKGHYKEFFELAFEKVKGSKTLIVCDNVFLSGLMHRDIDDVPKNKLTMYKRMKEFIDYIIDIDGKLVRTTIFDHGDGISVSEVL